MTIEKVTRTARWLLTSALAALLVGIAMACGSDPTATPVATAAPAATATSPPGAPAAATPTPTESKAAWEIKWDETLAAALEEGELIWGKSPGSMPPVIEYFGEKFGIDITITTGSSSDLIERILAERAAGKYEIDFFWAGVGTTNRRMIPNGMLVPVLPHLFLPEVLDESLWYRGQLWWAEDEKLQLIHSGRAGTLNLRARYNTTLVSEEDAAARKPICGEQCRMRRLQWGMSSWGPTGRFFYPRSSGRYVDTKSGWRYRSRPYPNSFANR